MGSAGYIVRRNVICEPRRPFTHARILELRWRCRLEDGDPQTNSAPCRTMPLRCELAGAFKQFVDGNSAILSPELHDTVMARVKLIIPSSHWRRSPLGRRPIPGMDLG